jgi:hypothetical protein
MTNYNKIENLKFVESERLKWESSSIAKEKQLKEQYTISLANNEKKNNLIGLNQQRVHEKEMETLRDDFQRKTFEFERQLDVQKSASKLEFEELQEMHVKMTKYHREEITKTTFELDELNASLKINQELHTTIKNLQETEKM